MERAEVRSRSGRDGQRAERRLIRHDAGQSSQRDVLQLIAKMEDEEESTHADANCFIRPLDRPPVHVFTVAASWCQWSRWGILAGKLK
jgi:hypothetical protein